MLWSCKGRLRARSRPFQRLLAHGEAAEIELSKHIPQRHRKEIQGQCNPTVPKRAGFC